MRAPIVGLAAVALTIAVAWTALSASASTSGPDPSGYTWTDSNAPSPFVSMDWIDISTTGTLIDSDTDFTGSDDGVWTQSLPFGFGFFGNTYDEVQISTNGFISFAIPGPEIADNCNEEYNSPAVGSSIPGNPIPMDDANCSDDGWGFNPLIAAFFDDLDLGGGCGKVFYGTNGAAPNRMFIVQWDTICHHSCDLCAEGGGITFEIILYESPDASRGAAGASSQNGDIKIQYLDGFFSPTLPELNFGASATAGLSFDGTTGLQYSHAQQRLTSGMAVLYQPGTATTKSPGDPNSCNDNYNWGDDTSPSGADLGLPIPHGSDDCDDDGWGHDPLIAAFYDEHDLTHCGEVYYGTTGTAPNRMFVVQWDEMCNHYCDQCVPAESVTFEVILYEGSNDILVQYLDGFYSATMPEQNFGASATAGLSFDSTTGLQYSYIQQFLTSGLAVLYQRTSSEPTPEPTETPTATPFETPAATATPAGQTVTWADVDCSGGINPIDSLKILRDDAGLDVSQEVGCPGMGDEVQITP